LMAWRIPAWFAAQGLPPEVTGRKVGPAGWCSGHKSHWRRVLGLAALALVLRLTALVTDLWLDDIATLTQYGRWSLWETLTTFVAANQHVFYVTLARISIGLFGPAEWSVRLPAVLFGVGSLLALYAFARLLTSEREA